MIGDSYILKIAQETQNAALVGLDGYLSSQLRSEPDASDLSTAIVCLLLGWNTDDLLPPGFAEKNAARIEREARKLTEDSQLCEILSGAAYNLGYGHYVKAGGGRILNRYIGFIRMDNRVRTLDDSNTLLKMGHILDQLDRSILKPIWALKKFGIWRPRPDNPNERAYYDALYSFASDTAKRQVSLSTLKGQGRGVVESKKEQDAIETWCEICGETRLTIQLESVEVCAECAAREKTECCENCFDQPTVQLTEYGWSCAECVKAVVARRNYGKESMATRVHPETESTEPDEPEMTDAEMAAFHLPGDCAELPDPARPHYEPLTVENGSPLNPRDPPYLAPGVTGYAVRVNGEIYIPLIGGDGTGKVGELLSSLSRRCVIVNVTSSRLRGMLERRGYVVKEVETATGLCDEWRRP